MTSICAGGGPSGPKQSTTSGLVFNSLQLSSYLNNKGAGWAYIVAPLIGTLVYNLPSFCAGEPPTFVEPDFSTVLNWFSPLNPLGAAQLQQAMSELVGQIVWYDYCDCLSGSTPAAPAVPTSIPGLQTQPAGQGGFPAQTCQHWSADTGPLNDSFGEDFEFGSPTNIEVVDIQAGDYFSGTFTIGTQGTSQNSGSCFIQWLTANKIVISTLGPLNLSPGQTGILQGASPSGTVFIHPFVTGGGTFNPASNTAHLELLEYCPGSTPSTINGPCCPTDPATSSMLGAIYQLLQVVQRQGVPFAYQNGATHVGVTGSGQIAVSQLLGVKLAPSATPIWTGTEAGNPDELWLDSWITWGNADGWTDRIMLRHSPQISLPPNAQLFTKLGYTFAQGLAVDIQELEREA